MPAKTTRNWMIEMREGKGLTLQEMAIRCDCSQKLLHIVECGSPTRPDIASNIARAYGMDVHQYNMLVVERHRARVIPKRKPAPRDHGISIYSYRSGPARLTGTSAGMRSWYIMRTISLRFIACRKRFMTGLRTTIPSPLHAWPAPTKRPSALDKEYT